MQPTKPTFLEISDTIYAVLKGIATEEQQTFFDGWIGESEANRQLFEKFRSEEALAHKYEAYEKIDVAGNQQKFVKLIARRKRMRVIRNCAAVLVPLILLAATWFYIDYGNSDTGSNTIARVTDDVILILPDGSEVIMDQSTDNSCVAEQGGVALVRRNGQLIHEKQAGGSPASSELSWGTVEVPKGTTFDAILEDGTHVWLNAGSRLRFPLAFVGDERRIFLEGEAYFDVAHNSEKPFIVETQEQNVKVLGTEFNIYAYSYESSTYTSLVDGRVSITAKTNNSEIVLASGQQARLDRAASGFTVQDFERGTVGAWRQGLFAFDGNTLEKIFHELARWYDFEYSFEDSRAAGLILMGEIPRYDDISRIFTQIETLGQVEIVVKKNVVTIKAKR